MSTKLEPPCTVDEQGHRDDAIDDDSTACPNRRYITSTDPAIFHVPYVP